MNAIRFVAFKHENLAQDRRFEIAQFEPRINSIRRRGRYYPANFLVVRSNSAAAVLPRVENIPHEPTRVRARYLESSLGESGTSLAWIESLNQREERVNLQGQNILLSNILDFFGLSD
ncbi:MAG: hypothetical protein ACP5N9_01685 [Candidatus Bilamarchaeum sp.]